VGAIISGFVWLVRVSIRLVKQVARSHLLAGQKSRLLHPSGESGFVARAVTSFCVNAARKDGTQRRRPRASIVVHLWKEVAAAFGRHVEQTPERVDKIAGAMVLFRSGRGKAHFGAPEVPHCTVLLPENVEDRFIPYCAHGRSEMA
jgi:hypothetical protein